MVVFVDGSQGHAMMVLWTLSLVAAARADSGGPQPERVEEVWAGHQVVFGERTIPILGTVRTQTDSFVLARVHRVDGYITLDQTACSVTFSEALGVQVSMPAQTLASIPDAHIEFRLLNNARARSASWFTGWGGEDIDNDGHPGATIVVDAPLCGGELYVANASTSQATARLTNNGMVGDLSVRVQQEVLDASNACLRWTSSYTDERQHGSFAYERVPAGATCESLTRAPWPVRAQHSAPPTASAGS